MFDLFRSRAKAVRYLLGGLLLLVALSMVVTLIPGYGVPGGTSDQVVVEVGKDVISVTELQQQLQSAMRNRSFPRELAQVYVPQMVDQMIGERVLRPALVGVSKGGVKAAQAAANNNEPDSAA